MKNFLKKDFSDIAHVILRVSVALLMLTHGWAKLSNFSSLSAVFPDPLGLGSQLTLILAIMTEFFCALFLLVGFLTRWSSLGLMFTMLVAAFVHHLDDPFSKKEKALLYAVVFLYFILTKSKKWALDNKIFKNP